MAVEGKPKGALRLVPRSVPDGIYQAECGGIEVRWGLSARQTACVVSS